MECFNILATNAGGIAYFPSTNITVGTESVDIALGFRRIFPVGYFTVRLTNAIPADTSNYNQLCWSCCACISCILSLC